MLPDLKTYQSFLTDFSGLLLAVNILVFLSRRLWTEEEEHTDDFFLNWGEQGTGTEALAWYPTNFLRDVIPKPIHSHNDYWRKVPLFSALHAGCISVEADVWLENYNSTDDLFVGHDLAALQPSRTFPSLYVNPIVEILQRQNPSTAFYQGSRRGVFDADPDQTLTLLVDVKTDGETTWPWVVEQLEPLRSRGWLTTFDNGELKLGPVTVVGSGNTPFDQIVANDTYRDVFYDVPLDRLPDSNFNTTNSWYASVSLKEAVGQVWLDGFNPDQLRTVKTQIQAAHEQGLKVRYWELPSWPISIRNHIWSLLVQEGVDLLNVDDLRGAARKDWSRHITVL